MTLATQDRIRSEIDALAPWFHNLTIQGVQTAPDHFLGDYPRFKWEGFRHSVPDDLQGRSVLDIGCNAGFFALEMKRRGAGRVVGIDSDPHYLRQADFAIREAGVDIELRQMSVYDIGALGERFDLVLFMGVFYHLRHPLLALDLIHEHVADDLLLFQSLQRGAAEEGVVEADYPFAETALFDGADFPRLHFVEHSYAGDPTNWFVPNGPAAAAMLRSAGFEISARPEPEVFLCRRTGRPAMVPPPPRIVTG
jgi:tRNA (mo5U34)-methyltransferase